jgi:hypothetical protein
MLYLYFKASTIEILNSEMFSVDILRAAMDNRLGGRYKEVFRNHANSNLEEKFGIKGEIVAEGLDFLVEWLGDQETTDLVWEKLGEFRGKQVSRIKEFLIDLYITDR